MLDLALSASASLAASREVAPPRFNPRPPGVIREGSATDRVLKMLRSSPSWRTRAQISWATGLSHGALTWALIYLKAHGLIEHIGDPARNARYFRYRATSTQQPGGSHNIDRSNER
jgi:hypothetical protein